LAKREKKKAPEGANWMDTYGDMITLILTFFVLLFAMSTMDKEKVQQIAQAFSGIKIEDVVPAVGFPGTVPIDAAAYDDEVPQAPENGGAGGQMDGMEGFFQYLQQAVKEAGLQDSVSMSLSQAGIYMRFRDSAFFLPDSDELTIDGQYVLETVADGMRMISEDIESVRVSGHTADSGGTSEANEWRLSTGRAVSVVDYFILLDAATPEKYTATGYGKYRPVADNETEEGRNENRRVEIVFIRAGLDTTDASVMNDLMKLMYGDGFMTESDIGGSPVFDPNATAEEPAEELPSDQMNPDRVYVNKDDYTPHSGQ
jgi:chemotaxis protein MotB